MRLSLDRSIGAVATTDIAIVILAVMGHNSNDRDGRTSNRCGIEQVLPQTARSDTQQHRDHVLRALERLSIWMDGRWLMAF